MKTIILTFAFLLSFAHAGIGGIGGGKTKRQLQRALMNSKHVNGGAIFFQKHTIWSKVHYDKTLCFDGFEYRTKVKLCLKKVRNQFGEKVCQIEEVVEITQPKESTKQYCKNFNRDEKVCEEWEEGPFIQKPEMKLEMFNDNHMSLGKFEVTVEECK